LNSMDFISDPLIEIIGLEYSSSALQDPQEKIDHTPRIGLSFLFLSP